LPVLNFGGQAAELWCEGGEQRFVTQLIRESVQVGRQVLWFSTLVSKASNLPAIETALKKAGARESQVVEMSQGNKQSRFVAWTFHDKEQQQLWRERTGNRGKSCSATKNRARITPGRGFLTSVLLVDSVSQAFGHNELDHFLGSDFDGSASRRVTASTGRTLGHFQFANTWQSDFAAIFQLISNDLSQLVQ
jgi:hypothetical protein